MLEAIEKIQSSHLKPYPHGFFTRQGGVSEGAFDSLNCGPGSGDDLALVAENRRRVAEALKANMLCTAKQVHSATCLTLSAPWEMGQGAEGDAIATDVPGVAIGVLTADCGPVLFADSEARVIGAAHAGWKGAIGGILESTIETMEKLGAKRERIAACIGPMIAQSSYEVGAEFRIRFLEASEANDAFFIPSDKAGHYRFDLPGYIGERLKKAGLASVASCAEDTLADETRFFSYRRNTLAGIAPYGRQVSAIALPL
ncbi:MAG: peptidoglycan editing factor PgeF [Alphaproteobacteria bacterium]|nr:peptidoglycan editing factor PgeF [Alphaproteobacteria bacterium]